MIVEHHFIELKQTQMCSSINDRTQTPESNLKHSSTHHKIEGDCSVYVNSFFLFCSSKSNNPTTKTSPHHNEKWYQSSKAPELTLITIYFWLVACKDNLG